MSWRNKTYHLRVVKNGKVVNLDEKGRPTRSEQPKTPKKQQPLSAKAERRKKKREAAAAKKAARRTKANKYQPRSKKQEKKDTPWARARAKESTGNVILKKSRARKLKEYADQLNANLPKSEQWFQCKFKAEPWIIHLGQIEYNAPYLGFIPDVLCRTHKFIIEVDGSIHNTEVQKKKDYNKTKAFEKAGFRVFRIEAYSDIQYNEVISLIKSLFYSSQPRSVLTTSVETS